MYAPISLHSSRGSIVVVVTTTRSIWWRNIVSLRSYFISILLRLATPTCSPKLVTESVTYRRLSDRSAISYTRWRWRRRFISLLIPPVELFFPRFFLRILSESVRRHPPVRELVSHIFNEDQGEEGKQATSRKTPSSGISGMIKRRNETHYMHREDEAFEREHYRGRSNMPVLLKFYSYANSN